MTAHYYAGFWRRFGAFWVDFLIFMPLMFIHIKLWMTHSRLIAPISLIVTCSLQQVYFIYCHWKWGRTIGKMATGIQVVSLDFKPISLRQAVLRNSVDLLFYAVSLIGSSIAFASLTDEAVATSGKDLTKLVTSMMPPWKQYVDWAQQAWIWSEFIVMMTNDRRRALHDYIAGTVVIQVRGLEKRKWDKDDPFNGDFSKDLKQFNRMKDPFKI